MVFDLSSASTLQAREERLPRAILLVAGLMLASGALYFAIELPKGVSGSVAVRSLFVALSILGTAVAGTTAFFFPATRVCELRIDSSQGITLVGPSHRTRGIPWSARIQTIILEDWRDRYQRVGYGDRRTGLIWVKPGPRQFDLSLDAFDSTIEAAKRAGWSVHILEFTVGAGNRKGVVRRITCKS